jgi:hypothetical protein
MGILWINCSKWSPSFSNGSATGLKAERDEWARTEQAKREGELIGRIEFLCELLDQPYQGERALGDRIVAAAPMGCHAE